MDSQKLDVLFVSEKALWPLDQGFRIRGSNMSRALMDKGIKVGTACMETTGLSQVPEDMRDRQVSWPAASETQQRDFAMAWSGRGRWLREKLARHQGVDVQAMAGVRALFEKHEPKIVVALGQHGPLLLRGLKGLDCQCIWYAADEPVRFQMSCMSREPWRNWRERIRQMAFYAALEWVFVRGLDGAIGVSPRDAQLLKWIGGAQRTAMIRNGVDLDYFKPAQMNASSNTASLVFWGRLDFEPNIDAVRWFAREVWPALKARRADATWDIVGKFPAECVREIALQPGVRLSENVPDLRPLARGAAVTILPMRCGGGIKNKLLEAAGMALPMVVSPRAIEGLDFAEGARPVQVCASATQWIQAIEALWADGVKREALGQRAREWVKAHHSWSAAADAFCKWTDLEACEASRPGFELNFVTTEFEKEAA